MNHTYDLIHYRARKLVGHIEKIKQVCSIQEITSDKMSSYMYSNLQALDRVTLQIPESRICIDPPVPDKLQLNLINCHSDDKVDLTWLEEKHIEYSTIFSQDKWEFGSQQGSSVHFDVRTNATVCHQKFYKINPAIKEDADKIINMLLSHKLIQVIKRF